MAFGPEHGHCKVCGKVCAARTDTCSAECQAVRDERLRTRRLWTGIIYVMMAILIAVFLISYLH